MSNDKYILLFPGEKNFDIKNYIENTKVNSNIRIISKNAQIVSCCQSGVIIGFGEGETVVGIYENEKCLKNFNVIVMPGISKFPLFVNRYNGLINDYIPDNLVETAPNSKIFVCEEVLNAFNKMSEDAKNENIVMEITEGYRSIEEQNRIIKKLTDIKGESEAMRQAAPAGFSEHHTGLAIDINAKKDKEGNPITDNGIVYDWISNNCYKYGFMVKNLKGKEHITGTIYEPWHIRYLGDLKLAQLLHDEYLTLDEYIEFSEWYDQLMFKNEESCVDEISCNEYEYVRLVAAEAEIPFIKAKNMMLEAKDKYSITFRDFYKMKLYALSEKLCIQRGEFLKKKADIEAIYVQKVLNEESITREELDRNLLIFNENPYARVDISEYVGLELYKKNDLEVSATLRDIKKRRLLRKNIEKKFEEIDKNELEYESMSPLLEEYYVVTERTILESDIEAVRETIEKCKPEILKNEETLIETVVDMLVCKRLMGFWDFEYFMFELYNKSIEERRKFVSNIYRTIKLSKVNDKLKGDIFDNKYKAYLLFNDFYDREMVLVDSEDCLKKFKDFIQKHEKVVVKPANGAMGDNIRLLKIDDNKDILNLFENLRNEIGDFIIEELIIAGRDIKTLNPDSVNTVRLSTYFNGKNVYMHWPFMKIGRSGFFVDNGGAGGILVAIDEKTGKFISDGIDENCNRYVTHPDNGIVFKGYKLPDWEKALDLGKNIAMMAYKKIPEVRYIGWDITYTEEGKWIVIEGNSFTQFIGQQAPLGIGVKDRLDEIIF